MLVNIEAQTYEEVMQDKNFVAALFNGLCGPKEVVEEFLRDKYSLNQLTTGVYQTGLNFIHNVKPVEGYEIIQFDFQRPGYMDSTFDEKEKAYKELHWYGVCDEYQQILKAFPIIENSDRKFFISITPMEKKYQEQHGGWRWHKWGEYIGIQTPTTEYLYDEPMIEKVYVFHVHELIPEQQRGN